MPVNKNLTAQSTFAQGSQPNPEGNFLEQFGVDPRTQEQILQQVEQQRVTDALSQNDGRKGDFAGDLDLQDSGAAIGAMLANKFNKPKLTPEQQRGQDAKADADKKIAMMEAGGKFENDDGDMDLMAKSNEYQRLLAGNLIKVGDPRGIDMARELDKRQKEETVYAEEREKAGVDIDGKRIDNTRGRIGIRRDRVVLEQAQYDLEHGKFLAKRGELSPIYLPNSKNPGTPIMAFLAEDGYANTMGDDGQIYQIPMTQYNTVGPAGADGSSFIPLPTEQKDMRASQRAIVTQIRLANVMVDALVSATDENGAINIMDGAGKFNTFAANLANNTNAIFQQGQKWVGLMDGDPNDPDSKVVGRMDGTVGGAMSYLKKNDKFADVFIPVPESIRTGSVQAQRYQAAVIQMAYAKARANEPGARQLSDADFKNAIKQIGAAATDPEALRQILMDNVQGAGADFDFWREQVGEDVASRIIQKPAMDRYDNAKAEFEVKFGQLFGTAQNPQGPLADPTNATGGTANATAAQNNDPTETREAQKARIIAGK